VNNKTERTATAKQRGAAVTELLFAVATLGAAVLVTAMIGPKIPEGIGD